MLHIIRNVAIALGLHGETADTEVDERGSEAIQFILLAVTLGIGLLVVFAFIRDKAKTQGSRVGSCIETGSTAASC